MILDISVFSLEQIEFDRGGVDMLLERVNADSLHGIDEAFVFGALLHIDLQQAIDHDRHLGGRERWPVVFAYGGLIAWRAADRDLIPLAAVFIDAENADIADVMMAAGIDATGGVQFDPADV